MPAMAPTPKPEQTEHFIAIKMELRGSAPKDWIDTLSRIDGVQIQDRDANTDPLNVIVNFSAPKDALAKVSEALGKWCHIEKIIGHFPIGTALSN